MNRASRKILIIAEEKFSRVCTTMLEFVGYPAENIARLDYLPERININEVGLIIISYPYGTFFFKEIKINISTIVFADQIDKDLMNRLDCVRNYCCMIKPIDYKKFRHVVNKFMGIQMETYEDKSTL
jgi:hypothetical protein